MVLTPEERGRARSTAEAIESPGAAGTTAGSARRPRARGGAVLDRRLAGRRVIDWLAHALAWLPVVLLLREWLGGAYWINPIQELTQRSGLAALWLLTASLAVTPSITLFGWRRLGPLRRTLGLYAFAYALTHFLIFSVLDYGLDPALLREAIFEKPFALVGLAALLGLALLALTSTRGWMRRLGKRWKRLHRLVYAIGVLVVVHYAWATKADLDPRPLAWGLLLALLLGLRWPPLRRRISRQRPPR